MAPLASSERAESARDTSTRPSNAVDRRVGIAFALPCLVLLLSMLVLGDWIIDDAGISFAYARNVARFDGFVSQPGRVPVEGYSNFTWVVLLVPTFWAHVFHPVYVPKLFGALEVCAGFYLLQRMLARRTGMLWPGVVLTSLLAVSPPIVIWTSSGLENGTLFLLVAGLVVVLIERPTRWEAKAGALAALLAMTRPDGLVFSGAAGLVVLGGTWRRRGVRGLARSGGRYTGAFGALFLPFFVFRLVMFHLPWPHTYYAKRVYMTAGERLHALLEGGAVLTKLSSFARGLAGPFGIPLLLATVVMLVVAAARRKFRRDLAIAALFQATAIFAFVWLDDDWMGEYRFGTAGILMSLVTAVMASHAAVGTWPRRAVVAWGLAIALALVDFAPRLAAFAANPTTPYSDIVRHARRFNRYAELLELKQSSLLTPDLGGELMDSKLTIYDAAGLCEPAVVHLLKKDSPIWHANHPEFYDWVFETVKPTFISTNGFFTNVTTLEYDPRFSRDYVAINRYSDTYVATVYHRRVHSGEFVRRDALRDPTALALLQQVSSRSRPDPWVVRVGEALGLTAPRLPDSPERLIAAGRLARVGWDANRAATLFRRAAAAAREPNEALQLLGETLDQAARVDEARAVWSELLRAAVRTRDFERAARAASRLDLPGRTEDAAAMEKGLHALYDYGDTAAAVQLFDEIARRTPTHLGAHYQLAVSLGRAGRAEEARAAWTRVLALATGFGDDKVAQSARAQIHVAAR